MPDAESSPLVIVAFGVGNMVERKIWDFVHPKSVVSCSSFDSMMRIAERQRAMISSTKASLDIKAFVCGENPCSAKGQLLYSLLRRSMRSFVLVGAGTSFSHAARDWGVEYVDRREGAAMGRKLAAAIFAAASSSSDAPPTLPHREEGGERPQDGNGWAKKAETV